MRATRTKTFQRTMKPFLEQLKEHQSKVLTYLTPEKLEKSTARDVIYCADLMTKNTQLLENKPTEIAETTTAFTTTNEAKEYIDKVLERGKKQEKQRT